MSTRAARLTVAASLVLSLAGSAIAAYLAFENLQSRSGVCTITHGCATVQQSRYGKLLGVPVSVPGLVLYVLLAVAAVAWLTNARGVRPMAGVAAFAVSLFGFAFSGYLTYIEGHVLDAWCIYCIASAALLTTLAAIWVAVAAVGAGRENASLPFVFTTEDTESTEA